MDHPTRLSWGLTAERLYPFRGPLSTAGIESPRAGNWRADSAAFRVQLQNRGWEWAMGSPDTTVRRLVEQGLRGADLQQALADRSERELGLVTMVEQLPSPENRIVPDYEHRDAIGIPRPRMSYRIDEYCRRALDRGQRIHQEILVAMNATEIQHGSTIFSAGHVMGTYRMGTDTKTSVVSSEQRSHDHPNLFLLGSGVFPTGAASNPTLTIAALALRAVDPIVRTAQA
jgi:glucose dehydrogenase